MFRSQSKSKSLRVQRETVRILSGAALGSVQGGGFQALTAGCQIVTQANGAACIGTQLSDPNNNGTSVSQGVGSCNSVGCHISVSGVGNPP